MSRFNRTNFFPSNVINGVVEQDIASNYFNTLFKITKETLFYTIKREDLQRMDIVSFKFYGTDEYWWILAKYNKIDDVWNDLSIGTIISIPDKQDIDNFYMQVKSYIRKNG